MTQVSNDGRSARILMELRPANEGFSGIPQETRLLFSAFQGQPECQVDGLINQTRWSTRRGLKTGVNYSIARQHKLYDAISKYIVSYELRPKFNKFPDNMKDVFGRIGLRLRARFGGSLPLDWFEPEAYTDFLWEKFFSKTLPREDLPGITAAKYRTLTPAWDYMTKAGQPGMGMPGKFPRIDTSGYDIFLGQKPYPAYVSGDTKLVIRYHDAIPMFLPQFVGDPKPHRASHYYTLRANAPSALFVCTTEAVRQDLLRLHPEVERRSTVIHDVVSHEYYPAEPPKPERVADIMCSRLDDETHIKRAARHRIRNAPWPPIGKKSPRDFVPKDLRFIMMVSTIEPRKNHLRLVRAWERLRARGDTDLKLVLVGSIGWDCDPMTNAFRPWQERGELFHLSKVPSADLRQLYASAECVVCPSVAEGFDLSGIEAMLCGSPVVASDIAVHREVYGPRMRYFDPYSVGAMADAIASFTGLDRSQERLEEGRFGAEFAKRYSKSNIVPRWLELFARIKAGDFGQ